MTRVYDDRGRATAVTVIDVSGNSLLQVKTVEADGYSALQTGYGTQKESRVNKGELGHFKKFNSEPKRFVREFRLGSEKLPAELVLKPSIFQQGQLIDVIGHSKGKGFQGIMRRHNTDGQGASHGSMMHRRPGSIGCRSTPGNIYKNHSMPGHMGDEQVTVQNLRIVQVRDIDSTLLVAGAVPGPAGGFVIVRPAIKHPIGAIAKVRTGQASTAKTGAKTAVKKK
jgi:large subunit ribosomal protein L3